MTRLFGKINLATHANLRVSQQWAETAHTHLNKIYLYKLPLRGSVCVLGGKKE